jgi:hypothetical protein
MSTDVMNPRREGGPGRRGGTGRPAAAGLRTAPAPETRRSPRPGRRPRTVRPAGPPFPASPVRPASPARPAGPGRPGRTIRTVGPPRQASDPSAIAHPRLAGRTGFIVLLLGLLGGGLMCLLVVNTTLAANSIQINQLQQVNAATTQRIQQLQQDVAAHGSAAVISREARKLGMRLVQEPAFINLRTLSSRSGIRQGDHIARRPAR